MRMKGTPCCCLGQGGCTHCVPHKIQDPDASGSGETEGDSATLVPDNDPWSNAPNVNFNLDDRQVKLNANHADNENDNWAVPVFLGSTQRERAPIGALSYPMDLSHPPIILPASCKRDSMSR